MAAIADRYRVWSGLLALLLIAVALLTACGGPEFIPAGTPNVNWRPDLRGFDGLPMVYVPAGCFMLGSRTEPEESPIRRVCLTEFWIGQTEVTNAQYADCVQAGACLAPLDSARFNDPAYADYPVVAVTWMQADMYARWLSQTYERDYRLPTEAQWEYAARGTEGAVYPWGDALPDCERANLEGCAGEPLPVGPGQRERGASWVGALDMAGNVWEWVDGWYGEFYILLEDGAVDPPGPGEGTLRVLRGGAWDTGPDRARASYRSRHDPGFWNDRRGFRVILVAGR